MATAIEKYLQTKETALRASTWASMFFKADHLRGVGQPALDTYPLKVRVCWQAYPCAQNYHNIPEKFEPYLRKTILDKMPELVKAALTKLEAQVKLDAETAAKEHARIMADAGLPTEPAVAEAKS